MQQTRIHIENLGSSTSAGGIGNGYFPQNDMAASHADVSRFQDALSRYSTNVSGAFPVEPTSRGDSLGTRLIGRANDLAGGLKQDQQHVSKMLEQATRTGDSMQLMKAMMALSDYQIRVQAVSKTVSKAISGVDQLTRLQ